MVGIEEELGHQQLITYQLTPHTPCAYVEQPLETLPHN
jgi:hypothetical protein